MSHRAGPSGFAGGGGPSVAPPPSSISAAASASAPSPNTPGYIYSQLGNHPSPSAGGTFSSNATTSASTSATAGAASLPGPSKLMPPLAPRLTTDSPCSLITQALPSGSNVKWDRWALPTEVAHQPAEHPEASSSSSSSEFKPVNPSRAELLVAIRASRSLTRLEAEHRRACIGRSTDGADTMASSTFAKGKQRQLGSPELVQRLFNGPLFHIEMRCRPAAGAVPETEKAQESAATASVAPAAPAAPAAASTASPSRRAPHHDAWSVRAGGPRRQQAVALWRFTVSCDSARTQGSAPAAPTPGHGTSASMAKVGASTPSAAATAAAAAGTPTPTPMPAISISNGQANTSTLLPAATSTPSATPNDDAGKASARADLPESTELIAARQQLDSALANLQHSQGSYALSSLWPTFDGSSQSNLASFSRVETIRLGGPHRRHHSRFLSALEERCAEEWLAAVQESEEDVAPAEGEGSKTASEKQDAEMKDATAAGEGETEEGEVQEGGSSTGKSSASFARTSPGHRFARSHLRLGNSVLLLPKERSAPLPSFLRLKTGSGRSEVNLVSFHVHTTDRALIVQIRPRASGLACLPPREDRAAPSLKMGTPLVLAPTRTKVVFCDAASVEGDGEEMQSAKEALERSLGGLCGFSAQSTGANDWIVVTLRTTAPGVEGSAPGTFLWPRSLAFLDLEAQSGEDLLRNARLAGLSTPRPYRAGPPTTMRQAKRHALQLAADTSELIRQIQVQPQPPSTSVAQQGLTSTSAHQVEPEMAPGVSRLIELAALTPQPTRHSSKEDNGNDDDEDVEGAMSAFDDDDASVIEVSPPPPVMSEEPVVMNVDGAGQGKDGDESIKAEHEAPDTAAEATMATRQPSPEPRTAAKDDKERSDLDLWGDLGFDDGADLSGGGGAGGGGAHEGAKPVRDEDDGMYGGLVTDADFSFFDDDVEEEEQGRGSAQLGSGLDDIVENVGPTSNEAMDVDEQARGVGDAPQHGAQPALFNAQGNAPNSAPSVATAAAAWSQAPRDTAADTPRSTGLGGAYASTLGDPPSLPGLTDGASAASPAVGGVASKTPRTPWSPPQELGDQHIVVVDGDGTYAPLGAEQGAHHPHNHHHHHHHPNEHHAQDGRGGTDVERGHLGQSDALSLGDPNVAQGRTPASNAHSSPSDARKRQNPTMLGHRHHAQSMRDLASKYESGKFAVAMLHGQGPGGGSGGGGLAKGQRGLAKGGANENGKGGGGGEAAWPRWTSRARASARAAREAAGGDERSHRAGGLGNGLLKARLVDRVRGIGKLGISVLDDGAASEAESGAPTADEEGMSSGEESGGEGAEDDEDEEEHEGRGADDLEADDDEETRALAGATKAAQRHAALLRAAAEIVDDPALWAWGKADGSQLDGSSHIEAALVSDDSLRLEPSPPRVSPPYLDNFLELLTCNPSMWWILCGGSEAEAMSGPWPLARSLSSLETSDVLLGAQKLQGPTSPTLGRLGNATQVEVLEAPTFLVGCQGAVAKAAPTTLRFWDKLPLSAVSGPRHVTAFALHSTESGMELSDKIYKWLERLTRSFETLGLGTHCTAPGALLSIESDPNQGLAHSIRDLAVEPEVWDDTVQSMFSRMRPFLGCERHVILYVIGEPTWPQPFKAILKLQGALKAYVKRKMGMSGDHLVLRLVPLVALTSANVTWGSRLRPWHDVRLDALAVYESCRLHPTMARTNKRPRFDVNPNVSHPIRLPAFTLAPRRDALDPPCFALRWPGKQSRVLERGMLLHVAYEALDDGTSTGKISATIMDERGQDYAASAWPRTVGIREDVASVWRFVADFAARAAVEWSVCVCRRGRFCVGELEAWAEICSEDAFRLSGVVWDLTLLRVDNVEPLALAASVASSPQASSSSTSSPPPMPFGSEPVLLDAATCDFAVFPTERLAVASACSIEEVDEGAGAEKDGAVGTSSLPSTKVASDLLALRSSMLVRVPRGSDMTTRLAEREGGDGEVCETKAVMFKPPPISSPHVTWIHLLQIYSTDLDTDEALLLQQQGGPLPGVSVGVPSSSKTNATTLDARIRRITTSLHELSTLARERCGFTCNLPWHLAMLDVTRRCLPSFNDSV